MQDISPGLFWTLIGVVAANIAGVACFDLSMAGILAGSALYGMVLMGLLKVIYNNVVSNAVLTHVWDAFRDGNWFDRVKIACTGITFALLALILAAFIIGVCIACVQMPVVAVVFLLFVALIAIIILGLMGLDDLI